MEESIVSRIPIFRGLARAIMATVDSILSFAQAHEAEMVATIRRFVECESPSDDPAAVTRFVELVSDGWRPTPK